LKIYIAFNITDKVTGGGNQFLKTLKKYLQTNEAYQENITQADAVLFNSHQCIDEVMKFKLRYPDIPFVHRIDGPMQLYNKASDKRDDIVFAANKYLADATIFQSEWSQQQNCRLSLKRKSFETVIHNAPDASIFNRDGKTAFSKSRKIKLICTSWSANWNKGFKIYQWLDEHLPFDKYEMIFIGNSPIKFKNIQHVLPINSVKLVAELKRSDIFITASQKDPCSNSLIEALHCGLPAVGLRDGGHPELIGKGGELFAEPGEIPHLLEKIANNYQEYQANIRNPSMEQVGRQYYDFIQKVRMEIKQTQRRQFAKIDYLGLTTQILFWKTINKINNVLKASDTK
jgi:glycosyltransferase involved in cell wall biosynthesis